MLIPARLQREARQAVLLLLAGPAAADRSVPGEQHDAVGAGAQRRFLADAEQRRRAALHPQPVQRAGVQRQHRRPGCFPGNIIPPNLINPIGRQMLNLFPLPDPALVGNPVTQGNYNYQFAGNTEKLRRDNVVARRLEHPAGHDLLYPRADRQGSLRPRPVQRNRAGPDRRRRHGFRGRTAATTSTPRATSPRSLHTFSASTVLEVIGGRNWASRTCIR